MHFNLLMTSLYSVQVEDAAFCRFSSLSQGMCSQFDTGEKSLKMQGPYKKPFFPYVSITAVVD